MRWQLKTTPTNLPLLQKKQATETEVSLAAVLTAIKNLEWMILENGWKKVQKCLPTTTHTTTWTKLCMAECKSKMENFKEEFITMKKETADLKDRLLEAERHKRRWNRKERISEGWFKSFFKDLTAMVRPNWRQWTQYTVWEERKRDEVAMSSYSSQEDAIGTLCWL